MAHYLSEALDAFGGNPRAENLARVLSELVASGVYTAREDAELPYVALYQGIEADSPESSGAEPAPRNAEDTGSIAAILLGFTSEAKLAEALGPASRLAWIGGAELAGLMAEYGYAAIAVNPGPHSFLAALAQLEIAAPSPATHAQLKAHIDAGAERELGAALIDAPLHIASTDANSSHAYGRGHDGAEAILAFTCPAEAWALDSTIEAAPASFARILGHAAREGIGIIVNPASRRFDIPAARVAELADGISGLA